MFSDEDWKKIAQGPPANHSQKDRIASLTMLYGVINKFFAKTFPDVVWHLGYDSLIAAARNGNTMPWAADGHLAIDSHAFYTNDTWNKLTEYKMTFLHSPECQKTSFGKCLGVMLPEDVAGTEKVMLALRPFVGGHIDGFAYSRAVDLKTGFYVGITSAEKNAPLERKKCRLGGMDLPVPQDVVEYLERVGGGQPYGKDVVSAPGKEAILFPEAHMECTAQRCNTLQEAPQFEEAAWANSDPFTFNFWRFYEFGTGKGRWTPVPKQIGNECVNIISTKSKRYPIMVKPLCN